MKKSNNLPVPLNGPLVHYRNPEEFAAACHAQTQLMRLVAKQKKDQANDQNYLLAGDENGNQDEDQFLFGQDFETNPEVWELDESIFSEEGIFGPTDLREL